MQRAMESLEKQLQDMLASEAQVLRKLGAAGMLKDADVRPLVGFLHHANPNVASAAAQALGLIGPPAGPHVADVLVGLLRHDVLAVREAVAAALMRVDLPE